MFALRSVGLVALLLAASACHNRRDSNQPAGVAAREQGLSNMYGRTLVDLRSAKTNLQQPTTVETVKLDQTAAVAAIDRAIAEIGKLQKASGTGAPVETTRATLDEDKVGEGRLHKALTDLKSARRNVKNEYDDPSTRDERKRALHEIDQAIDLTEQAMRGIQKAS